MREEWLHKRIKLQTRIRFGRPTLAIQRRPPEVLFVRVNKKFLACQYFEAILTISSKFDDILLRLD